MLCFEMRYLSATFGQYRNYIPFFLSTSQWIRKNKTLCIGKRNTNLGIICTRY